LSDFGNDQAVEMLRSAILSTAEYRKNTLTLAEQRHVNTWIAYGGGSQNQCIQPIPCQWDDAEAAITYAYVNYLGRSPEPAGLQFFLADARSGVPLHQISKNISATIEAQTYLRKVALSNEGPKVELQPLLQYRMNGQIVERAAWISYSKAKGDQYCKLKFGADYSVDMANSGSVTGNVYNCNVTMLKDSNGVIYCEHGISGSQFNGSVFADKITCIVNF
jgi:hypothetical protein